MSEKNAVIRRAAPRWAWDTIEETLRLEAESSAFDPKLRRKIFKALQALDDIPDCCRSCGNPHSDPPMPYCIVCQHDASARTVRKD